MQYTRLYADDAGESHFADVEVEFADVDYAPPAPPLGLSEYMEASQSGFLRITPGWEGEIWHTSPVRQFMVFVEGQTAVTASDGSRREFGLGDVLLLEDDHGKGHSSQIIGDKEVVAVVIHLD